MVETVRTRIALGYALLFAVVVLSVAAGLYGLIHQNSYDRLDESTLIVLRAVRAGMSEELVEHKGKRTAEIEFDHILNGLYQNSFPGEQIVIREGIRVAAYKRNLGRPQADLRHVDPAERGRVFSQSDLRVAAELVDLPALHARYTILVSTWRGDTLGDLSALFHALEIVVPLGLLMATLCGFLLARRTLAPLADMAATVDVITSSNLGRRVAVVNPRDEIGQLAVRFNELLERLQQSFLQQRRFMADASHELKTPLAAALTAAQVTLQKHDRHSAEYRAALRIVEEQMLRLRRIVGDMFLLAQTDTDTLELRRELFYLDELLAEACRAMHLIAERQGLRLQLASPLPEAQVFGDEGLIRQAIINLLDNACKYTPAGGSVEVRLTARGERCTIRVSDTGPGISEASREHVFERFYRVDPARSPLSGEASGGAGLGLAIARWIAERHDAAITLESTGPNGSTFAFELPCAPPALAGSEGAMSVGAKVVQGS